MRHDFVEKRTYVAYACYNLHQIGLVEGQFLSYSWFYTRDIPKIMGTGAECRHNGSALHVMLALRCSSRQIVVTDKELDGPDMVGELLGKRQRLTYQA